MKTQINEVCIINMGQSPDSSTYNKNGNGLPFFQGNADFGVQYPEIRMWCSEPTKVAQEGDILISVRAPIGAMNIAICECCIGRGLAALTVKKDVCERKYLWYALSNKVEELNAKGTGSTFKAINKKILEETEIPLPPLDEQRKIAAVLDKVSDLIARRRQQLDKLDEMVKARFVEMFKDASTNTRQLSEIAQITGGLTKNSKRASLKLQFPYLRVANVFFNRLELKEVPKIGVTENEIEKTLLQKGDLLFVEGNGSIDQIGRVAIWDDSIKPCLHQNHLIKVRFNFEKVNPSYALFYFMSESGRMQITSKSVSTSGLNTLSVKKIESLNLPVPPIDLQNQFAAFVEQTEKTKTVISHSLEKLETLKKALMQDYFG